MGRLGVALSLVPLFCILLATEKVTAEVGCIRGDVLDTVGDPVGSIYVIASRLDHGESIQVETDPDGYFVIDNALAGEQYDVLSSYASEVGRASSLGTKSVDVVRVTAVGGGQCPYLTLHQAVRVRLHVKATNLQTGETVPSVEAHFRVDTDTLWLGEIEHNGDLLVPAGSNLEIQIVAEGYENSNVLKVASSQPDEARDVVVTLQAVQMGCIKGTVLDMQGTGVPGAKIQTSPGDEETFSPARWTSTDSHGQFSIDGVQPGRYVVFTTAAGYPQSLTQAGMVAHVTVPSDVQCAKATIGLGPKAAKLRVTVVDGVTQQPINKAEVSLHGDFVKQGGWSQRAIGDQVPVPALTQFTVDAGAAGYEPSQETISPIQPEQTKEITVALQPKSMP
jgi:Carboxypeptidase regulatory-like domain